MRLFNTMSGVKEDFTPGPIATLYVCGVTPYDTTHLGHAFSYASFDILIRFLRSLGHEVRYAQNVTDIDDDILRKAREIGVPWDVLGREQTAQYQRDMANLNILAPTHYPHATAEIPNMVDIIGVLLERGHAYRAGSYVFFDSTSRGDFGRLAGLTRAQMEARFAETGDSPDNPEKRNRLDFILWKASAAGEPSWPSPWGAGRPGWHIECSTMAMHYLGPRMDIHGGGDDLVFPHHSCEIAQSESASGLAPFAKIWMHNAPLLLDGVKMSKSLGNLVLISDLLGRYSPDAVRLCLLRHHYRTPFDYRAEEMDRAAGDAEALRAVVARRGEPATASAGDEELPAAVSQARKRFVAALADDLDTPLAAQCLQDLAGIADPAAARVLRELGSIAGLTFGR
jgi:L-cysteine:1D-myo-inositol 2-amino-2-deoxy-alpha-D-glucopyranoside ligase